MSIVFAPRFNKLIFAPDRSSTFGVVNDATLPGMVLAHSDRFVAGISGRKRNRKLNRRGDYDEYAE